MKKWISFIPGIIVCFLIALTGMLLGKFFPSLGGGLFAILIGILVGNMPVSSHPFLKPGIKFSESKLLYYAIVLLGATLTFESLYDIGLAGIIFILLQMSMTIIFVIWYGKKLGFEEDFGLLMASGNAVCGSSAIASTAPAISAKLSDMAVSITIVNLLGTVMMVVLPLITNVLYGNEVLQSSALIGGTLQSVGQVVASGSIVSEAVKDQAAVFKISRIILLAVVVLALKYVKARNNQTEETEKGSVQWGALVPWYVCGFFILCVINSIFQFPETVTHPVKTFGNYLEIIALAAIGMSVRIKDLTKHGWKISAYAGGIGLFQITVAVILIFLFL